MEERDFFRGDERYRKESFVACGSRRDCWDRKESKPRIGVEVVEAVAVFRSRRRKTVVTMTEAAETVVVVILGVLGKSLREWN